MMNLAPGVSPAKLVIDVYKRRPVQEMLNKLGLKANILGPNIAKCRQLTVEQLGKFEGFLRGITDFARENFVINAGQLLPLELPSAAALRQINFDKLMSNEAAMKDVREMCVMPEGRPLIDLKLLPKIYQTHISSK